ncbi:hypothetical protein PMIN04_008914 [Paraphaeosphaeria minitans]
MRPTFILATLAIGALTAPLPGAEPWSRKTGGRAVQDPFESERRSAAPEPFDRGTHPKIQPVDADEDDIEARSFTRPNHQDGHASPATVESRSAIPNEHNERSVREHKRSVREKIVSGDDIETRGTDRLSNKRTTGDNENVEVKRYAEAEPGFTRAKPDHRREVEAEPLNRINGKKRTAEPTIPSQKRDASP